MGDFAEVSTEILNILMLVDGIPEAKIIQPRAGQAAVISFQRGKVAVETIDDTRAVVQKSRAKHDALGQRMLNRMIKNGDYDEIME